jgi:16S rRNA (cytidine1402-2'-O)-methyltransferase
MGTLFVVATPIGNLNDISNRTLETLRDVDVIACEDTRHTIKILNHFGIQKPMVSYHEFNEEQKAEELANKLAGATTIALVCDAGTPAIADPGYRLVRLCRQRGIAVVPIPGPNAAIAALSASGLPSDEFVFLGFLPSKKNSRREKLAAVANVTSTFVFYEAPHRIEASLEDLQDVLGDREICLARELTKVHEEFVFGKISEVRPRVTALGEFVVIVSGATEMKATRPSSREEALKKLGMTRNELYDLFFKKKQNGS